MIKSSLKFTLLLLLIALILLLLCGTGFQYGEFRVSLAESTRAKFLLYTGTQVELTGNTTLAQTFTANYPGLSQIDVLFVGQPDPQPVTFSLKAACDAPDVILSRQVDLPPANSLAYYPFTFEPLDNSAGQTYCLVLAAPEGSVQLQLSGGDLYPFGQLEIHAPQDEQDNTPPPTPPPPPPPPPPNRVVTNTDMPFKTYLPIVINHPQSETISENEDVDFEDIGFLLHYNGRFWPMTQVFAARLTANKPYFWGQPWFYAGLAVVYGVLLVGLFRLAWRMKEADEEIER